MVNLRKLPVSPEEQLKRLHWDWMLGKDTMSYITDDVVVVTQQEAEAYADAANQLYEMFIQAGQHVIDNHLYTELGIPKEMAELIRNTWEDDRNLHLYGRFDLSGGLDGEEIRLIEFNADTATCIPETSVVQWAHAKANNLEENSQFNFVYEALAENFRRLKFINSDLSPTLLISTIQGYPEDDTNATLVGEAAADAGFYVRYQNIEEVDFSAEEGIFIENERKEFEQFHFWFKLVPWEYIANDEPSLLKILAKITKERKAVIINPAYTLLFQSKGILKILWDLYPYHPLLLESSFDPLRGKAYVEKVMFGREGANVKIFDSNKTMLEEAPGDYYNQGKVYQQYVEFMKDNKGNHYQPGIFFSFEACGLGFRRGGRIIGNTAQFTGHIINTV